MLDVDVIASWYAIYHDEPLKIHLLTLLAVACFKAHGYDVKYDALRFLDDQFNFGITQYDKKVMLTEKEIHLLKFIQHVYGYYSTKKLLGYLASKNVSTIEEVCASFKFEMIKDYEGYQFYDFNEFVIILNEIIYYIQAGTHLSNEEIERLKQYHQQESYYVFRDIVNGKLVVY